MVKEIVKDHDFAFSNRPKTTAADILLYGCKDLGFAPYGEYWKQVKKMSVVELLSHQRVQSFQFVRDEEVQVVIDKIRSACLKEESINLTEMVVFVSNDIVSRCVLSRKTKEDDVKCSKFGLLAKRLMILLTSFFVGYMFPYLRWLEVLTGLIPSLKALSRELDAFLDLIIEEHGPLKSNGEVTNKKDFLSIIFQLQKDGMLDMDLTQDNVKAILLDMFLAGTDTTSSTAEWMMAEILKHPKAMKKLQEEVRDVVGKRSKVEMDDISKMNYLKCAFKETLRVHPVAPLLLP